MRTLLLSLILFLPQEDFVRFGFCHRSPAPGGESRCVELSRSGTGLVRVGLEDEEDPLERPLELSPFGHAAFLELLSATDYLRDAEDYESDLPVAALGDKTLVLEGEWGRREALFNYSTRSEVSELVTFFEQLIAQELLIQDIETAQRFDRLSVPGTLERLQRELGAGRLADPPRLIPLLGSLAADERLLMIARRHAADLQAEIEKEFP